MTGALSVSKRATSHPRSGAEAGWWPRGVTPSPRSGAAAQSARLQWHRNCQEELPKSEVRGGGREDKPDVQGVVTAWAEEG